MGKARNTNVRAYYLEFTSLHQDIATSSCLATHLACRLRRCSNYDFVQVWLFTLQRIMLPPFEMDEAPPSGRLASIYKWYRPLIDFLEQEGAMGLCIILATHS